MARCVALVVLALTAVLAASPAAATSLADGKLVINGYGNWNYAKSDGNYYFADDDGDWRAGEVTLSFIGRPSEGVTVQIQPFFEFDEDGVETEIDMAYGQYAFSDAARLRFGVARHPFGIYTPIYDAGTLRPFMHLPTALYSEEAGIIAESYAGAGLTGMLNFGSWSLDYDLYGGALSVASTQPWEAEEEGMAGEGEEEEAGEVEETNLENLVGAKVVLHTPLDGLSFGGSLYTADVAEGHNDDASVLAYGLQLEYLTDRISLRAEYATASTDEEGDTQAAYAEAAWMATKRLQLAVRGEWGTVKLDEAEVEQVGGEPDDALTDHQELAIGVNWWFSPQFVLKVSYHMVDGLRFAVPGSDEGGEIDERTNTLIVGAAFSF